ncbi:MAG: transposase, partial [Elusimicrobia bacterium]|nr:transposase [Elusimicrobiota bacterium]
MVALLSHAIEELRSVLRLGEEEAQALLERQVLREELECPRCSEKKLYILEARRRWRCSKCRYTFGLLAGRFVSRLRIPARSWLAALKAFEAGLPAESAGQLAQLSRPTLYKALNLIRVSLAAKDPRWSEALAERPQAAEAPAVFGVRREGGKVELARIEDAEVKRLAAAPPKIVHRDGVVFTAPHGRYASLVADGRERLGRGGADQEAAEPFLKFLEIQTSRHYSIPRKAFPLYL